MNDNDLELYTRLIELEAMQADAETNTETEAPSYPDGYGPRAAILKLDFLNRPSKTPDIEGKLDIIEYYFLCPIFIVNKGHALFKNIIRLHRLKERSFPVKKIPAMIYIAMNFDEFVSVPFSAILAYFIYYAPLNEDYYITPTSADYFPDFFRDCVHCAEGWDLVDRPRTDHDLNFTLNNMTRELGAMLHEGLPSCPQARDQAQFYIMQAFNNLTMNRSCDPRFYVYKYLSDDLSQFIAYEVSCWDDLPDNILTAQCDMNEILDFSKISMRIATAALAIPAYGLVSLMNWAVGWKFLS